ncbi:SCP2 sterol-binding domain-containing protein [Amycolatopsis sp. RTGN1]|uniref:SCP2 sterol-binding domain-containing protein n=1 Tax=Amycolatopsis ponsaeliensis TaxID=2992142 RepID=UPI00254FD638|nr:SCP2 sterol-binding domain-containing protein [Amycolatopsis sp. RTGN1]
MTAVKFLSDEYLDELGDLVTPDLPEVPHVNVRLQFHATDTPEGEVDYHLVAERGVVVRAGRGLLADSDLAIRASYRDLLAFESGELHAATAFVTGQFAVTGDRAKVLDLMVVLQSGNYQRFIADLWARTTW